MNKLFGVFLVLCAVILSCSKKDNAVPAPPAPAPTNAVVASDSFNIMKAKYVPVSKTTSTQNNNWVVQAHYTSNTNSYPITTADLRILFRGPSRILSSGTYTVQPDSAQLTAGQACIKFADHRGIGSGCSCAWSDDGFATAGQLQVSIANNGQVHILFKNLDSKDNAASWNEFQGYSTFVQSIKLSGDITCY